jgi:predicted  nucleic acid-binding Zn-ribbon protein
LEADYEKLQADHKTAVNELEGARGELSALREKVSLLASELEEARSKIAADLQRGFSQEKPWTPSRYAALSVHHWRQETPEEEARRRKAENKLLRL